MTKKPILAVYMEGSEFEQPRIKWEFGKINSYFLIGILEDIKQELINQIDEESENETT